MPTSFLALILLAAFLHAAWNAVIKTAPSGLISMASLNFVSGFFGLILIFYASLPSPESLPYALLSTLIHTAYCSFLVLSYRQGDLSLVYPIARGSGPVFVALLSGPFVGEALQISDWGGIALVSLGVIAMSLSGRSQISSAPKPILLALVTGLCVAGYTIVDGLGSRASLNPMGYIGCLTLLFSIPLMAYCCATRFKETTNFMKHYWLRIILSGLMACISYGITLWVMNNVQIAHVAAMREVSVVFAALIGAFLLGEAFGISRIAASLLVLTGLFFLHIA